jgi:Leucine-rich repeat (LRR) protein
MKSLFVIPVLAFALSAAAAPEAWITALGGTVARDGDYKVIAVNLENSWVTDSDLPLLAAHPSLTRLNLSMTRITDRGLLELKPLANLTDLDLYYAESITDQGFSVLKNLKRLTRLNLRGTKVTDSTLHVLNGLTSLESLDIGFAQVTDSGILRLTALSNLKHLSAGGNKLTNAGLQALRQFPTLTSLDLSGSQRTDSSLWSVSLTEPGLEIIATLEDLRELRLNGMSVGPRGREKLKSLSKLERLDLQSCSRINDDAVAILQSLPALHVVDVSAAGPTEKGLNELRNSRPGLRIIASRFQPTNPAMPNGPAN